MQHQARVQKKRIQLRLALTSTMCSRKVYFCADVSVNENT